MVPDLAQPDLLISGPPTKVKLAASAGTMQLAARSGDSRAAREAAMEFEAVFLSEMLTPVFEDLESDGLFGGGSGERIYRSLLVQELGRTMARSGGVGIADAVQREIMKVQEMHS
ncbi:MAG: rod-binding protein [Kiloniellales bacterium]